jgi:hypothetical protein
MSDYRDELTALMEPMTEDRKTRTLTMARELLDVVFGTLDAQRAAAEPDVVGYAMPASPDAPILAACEALRDRLIAEDEDATRAAVLLLRTILEYDAGRRATV